MSDYISRQAAIDAIGGNKAVGDPSQMDEDEVIKMWERIRIINVLNRLPSAEPEKRTNKRTETHGVCLDAISRQAAVDALPKPQICEYMDEFGAGRNSCAYDAEKAIKDVPAADVVPVRHGHWTLVGWLKGLKVMECSCCKKRAIGETNFCPNCGAKMDGKREE